MRVGRLFVGGGVGHLFKKKENSFVGKTLKDSKRMGVFKQKNKFQAKSKTIRKCPRFVWHSILYAKKET